MTDTEPLMPQDLAAEQSVLGGCLISPQAMGACAPMLTEQDFYRPAHQLVWAALMAAHSEGRPHDAIATAARLGREGTIVRVGGAPYLHTLVSSVPTASNAGYYAHIVSERAVLRRVVEVGTRVVQLGYSTDGDDAGSVVARAQAVVADLDAGGPEAVVDPLSDVLSTAAGETSDAPPVPLGLASLDRLLGGGVRAGQLVVIAARPAVGKSALVIEVARRSMQAGRVTALASLEMSSSEVWQRVHAAGAGVDLTRIREGQCDDTELALLTDYGARVDHARLQVTGGGGMTLPQIAAHARRTRQRHDRLDLLAVDYLQLVTAPRLHRDANREQQVAALSRGLKLLAGQLAVPVLLAAQLNRNSEQRADKRPVLADLRESGAIEQDADIVILLHPMPDQGVIEAHVAKQRHGPVGTEELAWNPWQQRLSDVRSTQ